ncbi:MAG: LysR family transcriptional regulator [Rhodocyclaceae bacterium]|nr:LysR family transcriptional regulator [Rhodocyclaceae bacterium]
MPDSPRRTADYRIDPFDLHLFSAVVEHGTITAAAAQVNLSLAAASGRLKALEAVTGSRLLERSKAGARPTDAGLALARHARRVLAELEALHVELARFGQGLHGTVRLICNTAALSESLPDTLAAFLQRNPQIDVDVQELPSDAALDALRRGVADLAIVADYVDTTGLDARPWREDRLVALVPRGGLPGTQRSIAYREVLAHALVGLPREAGLSRFLAAQARRSGLAPRHRVRLAGFGALARLVAAGVGVAVVPEGAALRHRSRALRIVPLADPWARRRLLLCLAPGAGALAGVRALADALSAPRAPHGER